jgi:hypothetical protein
MSEPERTWANRTAGLFASERTKHEVRLTPVPAFSNGTWANYRCARGCAR